MLKKRIRNIKNNNVLDKNKKHNVLGNIDYILNLCVNVPIFQLQIYVCGSSSELRNIDPDLKFRYWSSFEFVYSHKVFFYTLPIFPAPSTYVYL